MEQAAQTQAPPNPVIDNARPVAFTHHPGEYKVKIDPARAWLRLNEVAIPAHAPVMDAPDPSEARAVDLLRSRLARQLRQDGVKKLAITAPTKACNAHRLAAQLALSLARQVDLKVMLLDFDLRAPQLATHFGLSSVAPIWSALTGVRREFDSSCLKVGDNLALSLATQPGETPAELLATTRSKALLDEIEHDFAPDLMLMNLPPVLSHDDAVSAAGLYDAALLVARSDHTTRAEIDRTEALISEQKPCLGVVLTHCRFVDEHASG
ncbi:MAG: hypothetical protein AAF340_03875 [Pseudomonadota bacterium]